MLCIYTVTKPIPTLIRADSEKPMHIYTLQNKQVYSERVMNKPVRTC